MSRITRRLPGRARLHVGYLLRATNDDMGDAPGPGTPGTVGEHVLGNERDNDEAARAGDPGQFTTFKQRTRLQTQPSGDE